MFSLSIITTKRDDPNLESNQAWFENLISIWVQYLSQTVYWPSIDGLESIKEISFAEKAEIIAYFLQYFCIESNVYAYGSNEELLGRRFCEGKLLKILNQDHSSSSKLEIAKLS